VWLSGEGTNSVRKFWRGGFQPYPKTLGGPSLIGPVSKMPKKQGLLQRPEGFGEVPRVRWHDNAISILCKNFTEGRQVEPLRGTHPAFIFKPTEPGRGPWNSEYGKQGGRLLSHERRRGGRALEDRHGTGGEAEGCLRAQRLSFRRGRKGGLSKGLSDRE